MLNRACGSLLYNPSMQRYKRLEDTPNGRKRNMSHLRDLGRGTVILWLAVCGLAGGLCPAAGDVPPRPNVPLQCGPEMVQLVRSSMKNYLLYRLASDRQPLPRLLRDTRIEYDGENLPLGEQAFGVALTLRNKGDVVARTFQDGEGLAVNLVEAARQALRSPALGDRVRWEDIQSLRIELEILSPVRPVARSVEDIHTGLSGLVLSVGRPDSSLQGPHLSRVFQRSMVLPSTAYIFGLTPDGMKRTCLSKWDITAEAADLQKQWSVFSSVHFVAYPQSPVLSLYRGKILQAGEQTGQAFDRRVAAVVARYLLRCQQPNGRYLLEPEDSPADALGQCHAARAMALAAGVLQDGEILRRSAEAAVGFVASHEAPWDSSTPDASTEANLEAAACFARAIAQLPKNPQTREISSALAGSIEEKLKLVLSWDRPSTDRAVVQAVAALLDLGRDVGAEPLPDAISHLLERNRQSGPSRMELDVAVQVGLLLFRIGPDEVEGGGPVVRRICQRLLDAQITAGAADEIGGFRLTEGGVDTAFSARAADLLRRASAWSTTEQPLRSRRYDESARAARQFCRQMIYRPMEAYFRDDPDAFVGAVRARPDAAEIRLQACAAVLEVLLSPAPETP